MKPPTLFLDVDGVLNRCGGEGLEEDKVELLRQIVAATDTTVVVSSSWHIYPQQMSRLLRLFHTIGARYGGFTPFGLTASVSGLFRAKARGAEIQEWLDANGRPERFVLLDDDPEMGELYPYQIRTESRTGLTPEIARHVIAALQGLE